MALQPLKTKSPIPCQNRSDRGDWNSLVNDKEVCKVV